MKNVIRFASALFILFATQSQLVMADDIPTVTVTATKPSSSTGGSFDAGGSPVGQPSGPAASQSFVEQKMQEGIAAAARNQCNAAAETARSSCKSAAIKTLDMDQLGCASLAALAGIYTVTGGAVTASGVGAPVGVVILGAGAIQTAGAAYCYNHAANTKSLADIACDDKFRIAAQKCDAT